MQEKINFDTTLGDFVAQYPKTRKVFEKFGLDYCCGGKQDIKTAAKEKDIQLNELILALETAINEAKEKDVEKIWINEPLNDIVHHIVSTHHAFMYKELPYVDQLLDKIVIVHGPKHGDFLNCLNSTYKILKESLEHHLSDEETLLFPYIKELEEERNKGVANKYTENFQKIIDILYTEHDEAGAALSSIRELTSNYVLPDDACASFEALYEHLQAIEDDLHEHVHLENTVLFPRITALMNS